MLKSINKKDNDLKAVSINNLSHFYGIDENKKQADICLGCSTIKLSKKVTELIQNINSTN